jgi:hypothetical protein
MTYEETTMLHQCPFCGLLVNHYEGVAMGHRKQKLCLHDNPAGVKCTGGGRFTPEPMPSEAPYDQNRYTAVHHTRRGRFVIGVYQTVQDALAAAKNHLTGYLTAEPHCNEVDCLVTVWCGFALRAVVTDDANGLAVNVLRHVSQD